MGECSWGDCAVIAWAMAGGVIAFFSREEGYWHVQESCSAGSEVGWLGAGDWCGKAKLAGAGGALYEEEADGRAGKQAAQAAIGSG